MKQLSPETIVAMYSELITQTCVPDGVRDINISDIMVNSTLFDKNPKINNKTAINSPKVTLNSGKIIDITA
jgi:hypothetical protein